MDGKLSHRLWVFKTNLVLTKRIRKFGREFKLQVVELSYSKANFKELANEMGIRPKLTNRWRGEFATYEKISFPVNDKR